MSFVDHPEYGRVNWRFRRDLLGGMLMEKTCHDFDVFNWLIGSRPLLVSAFGAKGVFRDRKTMDHAVVIVEYENGAKGVLDLCLFMPFGRTGRRSGLIGDKGSLDIFESQMEMYQYSRGDSRVIHHQLPGGKDAHAGGALNQHKSFVRCVREGKKPFADGQVGRESLEIPWAAQQAIERQQVIRLAP